MSEIPVSGRKLRAALFVIAILCCLPTRDARADSLTTQVTATENTSVGNFTLCQDSASCQTGSIPSVAQGSLSAGTAGDSAATASVLPNVSGTVYSWAVSSYSTLSYNNTVDVPAGVGSDPLPSGNIIFTLTVDGTESTSGLGGSTQADIELGANESFVNSSGSSMLLSAGTSTVEISTPVSAGSAAFSFTLFTSAQCPGYTALQMAGGDTCTASVDFSDPATITGAAVYDANGNLVSDASIVSQSGYVPPTAAPEPATLLLTALGMMSLLGLRRYRPAALR